MDDSEATSLEQIRAFLEASGGTVQFAGRCRKEVYAGGPYRTRADGSQFELQEGDVYGDVGNPHFRFSEWSQRQGK
jgi:hypothetical protein